MSLEQLAVLSRFYGADPDYVIAGGGNTSFKDEKTLWIKSSGVSLATIEGGGFVAMDRAKLAAIWNTDYPEDPAKREAAVLADLMAARKSGEENKRPSVETLLHDMLPFAYVVHTHPSLVNGLTCSVDGEAALKSLLGDEPLWVPISDPGFVLAWAIRSGLSGRAEVPALVFLQNHGVFVGADTPEAVKETYSRIVAAVGEKITRRPDFRGECEAYGNSREAGELLRKAAESGGERRFVRFRRNNEIARLVKDRASFAPVSSAYTPDHIVYSGSDPLFIEDAAETEEAFAAHSRKTGRPPKIAAVRNLGIFGIGSSEDGAVLALELFTDTMKVAAYAEAFGGPRFMTDEKIAFINNWEAERYRQKLAEK
ncbi:MAG: class II aldolase/adducin family protein [Treponema sp.]|jgi:rhamnose utilization protein RhaD (predicted bifunctional aldolase and dehydrogenase)|nr:class II aldolase/adducin family protein [Treponema sp.]